MITIRHRTASGRLDHMWEYDPARKAIIIVFCFGKETPTEIDVEVCSPTRPRWDAFALLRHDSNAWRLLAERYRLMPYEDGVGMLRKYLVPQPYPIHARLTRGDQFLLTCAPDDVDREIALLAEPSP